MIFKKKLKLYVDADDTILKSSEAVIELLNKKNGTHKTIKDMRDWGYRSIDGSLSRQDVEDIYNSPEFFEIVETDPAFDKMMEEIGSKLDVTIVTKGQEDNLELKRQYLTNKYDNIKYFGICFDDEDGKHNYDKSLADMYGGICVDDRVDCLRSCNANVKILILNNRQMGWASREDCVGIENLYIVNTWEEASEIIKFAMNNKFFMETID